MISNSYLQIHAVHVQVQVRVIFRQLLSLLRVGRPVWREDGSVICSAITHWLESRRTHNHILLSHLRLPQPGGPGVRIYIPQEQGCPVIPRALGSLYVRSYDSQSYGGGIPNSHHTGLPCRWSWSSSCGRQSVDQFVWVSGLPLGPLTRFYLALLFSSDNYLILLSKASSLTRKRVWVCSAITHWSQYLYFTVSSETAFPFCRLLRRAVTTVEVF
jgi:hypothetical protein